jgi:hypothetical protein
MIRHNKTMKNIKKQWKFILNIFIIFNIN